MADVPATELARLGPAKTIAKKARRADDSLSSVAAAEALRKDVENVETVDEAPGPGDTSPRKKVLEEKNDGDVKGEEGKELEGEAEKEDISRKDSPEYDVKHPTGDAMRDKVRGLLTNALATGKEGGAGKEERIIAAAIEEGMFKKFDGNGAPYKTKYRNISFNLKDKKNGKLRAAIMGREILPSELLEMTSEELANEELKKTREKVHEKMTRDAMPYNQPAATTDQFKCGKCKQRKCTYFQMQTRSADEPLTTFVSCVNCGNRWKF